MQEINPVHHRQLERVKRDYERTIAFEGVANEWLALKDWQEITKSRRLKMLERVVPPRIGDMPIKAITSARTLDVLKGAAQNNGPSVAAEAKRTKFGVFELAISTLRANSDPVHPVRRVVPTNKTQHKWPLSKEEIGQLLRDVETHAGRHETLCAFRMMLLTLCRPNEAVKARWSEFDLGKAIWRIPAE